MVWRYAKQKGLARAPWCINGDKADAWATEGIDGIIAHGLHGGRRQTAGEWSYRLQAQMTRQ